MSKTLHAPHYKPRSGERIKLTAQAVGWGENDEPAPKGRKKIFPEQQDSPHATRAHLVTSPAMNPCPPTTPTHPVFVKSAPRRSRPLQVTTATSAATSNSVHANTGANNPPYLCSANFACNTPFREASKFPN